MIRSKNNKITYILILLLLGITLGYAYLNTTLNINGTTNITSANWSIYWDNIVFGTNNTTDVTTPATISSGLTEVTFNVNFKEPGDTYEFTVDAVNDGTIDAMISTFSKGVYASNGTTPKTLPDYLEYTVTYSDGIEIANKQLLESGKMETYKVRVHYKEDITATQLPSTDDNYMFKFSVAYAQKADDAVPVSNPNNFSTDSWPTIIRAAKSGNISAYHVGDTKEVDMGTFGTHTLRIANTTTPAECSTEGFSQTACGFVLEFADIITTHRMNPYTSGNANLDGSTVNGTGNKGGWKYSDMRAFLNSTTYTNESIDYSTTGIYSSLPEILRNAIINTRVVSGHGSVDTTNYTTTDKLYLLSTREVWNYTGSDDTAQGQTRQLDYYESQNVTISSYAGAIKQRNGSNAWWWLRSAYSSDAYYFYFVASGGYTNFTYAYGTYSVSPAFRLG